MAFFSCYACGRLRYVPQPSLRFRQRHRRGTCQSRYCATHHDCHHTGRHSAIPLCQHSAPHVHFAPTPDCPSNLPIATLQPKFLYNFNSLCGIIDVTQYFSYNTISGYISLLCSTNCMKFNLLIR